VVVELIGHGSPHSLIADARHHGVSALPPDVNASQVLPTLRRCPADVPPPRRILPGWKPQDRAIQLGLAAIRGVGERCAQYIVAEREASGPYSDMADLAQRVQLNTDQLEALAAADVFSSFRLPRRQALWSAGAVGQLAPDWLAGVVSGTHAPLLPGLSDLESAAADMEATGVSTRAHPMEFVRERLESRGVLCVADLSAVRAGSRVSVAGLVTHRQRPGTASGVTFINLEDETGMLNVICSPGLWVRYRSVARSSVALVVRGRVESQDGALNFVAEGLERLDTVVATTSRDFK
ncbi:MAG: OB-fold nucleic acid binding domain-containing protein, partial [Pseudonocardiaceae bacterium]